ncbi:MAG: YhbY family RNA-binding protein [Bacilli bacterium]|nr:YhbY family RNA-binding protein [Bacilli bacterium]MBN2697070.1 YhbY family RNA-binding protein [Bacilli bacterium]
MDLNGKQKSKLRSLAQTIKPIFQIGKEGLSADLLKQIHDYLAKNELVKVTRLNTCPDEPDELLEIFRQSGIEVVQTIGKAIVLYKANPRLKDRIEL